VSLLPLPGESDQQVIIIIFESIDLKISRIEEKLTSYQTLFKTLLHELMSGARRI